MSRKTKFGASKCLTKDFHNKSFYLFKSWDLAHGNGWFCQVYDDNEMDVGCGFHKTNKFTAVKDALLDLKIRIKSWN